MKKLTSVLLTVVAIVGLTVPSLATADEGSKIATEALANSQAYLGLGVGPLHPDLTSQLPDVIGKGRGVLVEQVVEGSPAARAEIKKYDILVRVDGQDLYSPEQLVKIVRNAKPDSVVKLSFVRAGKLDEVEVNLSAVETREPVRSLRRPRLSMFDRLLDREDFGNWLGNNNFPNVPRGKSKWESFKSMSIKQEPDGTYKVHVEFRDGDKNEISRDYVGSREEIRTAIKEDKDLPEDERQHLLRSLDKQDEPIFNFPALKDWDSELFNWPNLDF